MREIRLKLKAKKPVLHHLYVQLLTKIKLEYKSLYILLNFGILHPTLAQGQSTVFLIWQEKRRRNEVRQFGSFAKVFTNGRDPC